MVFRLRSYIQEKIHTFTWRLNETHTAIWHSSVYVCMGYILFFFEVCILNDDDSTVESFPINLYTLNLTQTIQNVFVLFRVQNNIHYVCALYMCGNLTFRSSIGRALNHIRNGIPFYEYMILWLIWKFGYWIPTESNKNSFYLVEKIFWLFFGFFFQKARFHSDLFQLIWNEKC